MKGKFKMIHFEKKTICLENKIDFYILPQKHLDFNYCGGRRGMISPQTGMSRF